MVKDISAGTPNLLVVVDALTGNHDDAILLQKVFVCQRRVMLYLLNVDDAAAKSKCLIEHSNQSRTSCLDEAEIESAANWVMRRTICFGHCKQLVADISKSPGVREDMI